MPMTLFFEDLRRPWGVRRDASNWNAKDNGDHLIVNRGYMGHE